MIALPGADRLAAWQRRRGRHKRILAAERAFHNALLETGPGDICIDCGANVGDYTAHMARGGATVHAFDPDPAAFARLAERFAGRGNVVLHNTAVGAEAGRAVLHRDPGLGDTGQGETGQGDTGQEDLAATVSSSLLDQPRLAGGVEVEVIDLVAFLDGLDRAPSVVKLDIEGAEVALLERLFATDHVTRIGHLFVETHEWQMPALRARTLALVREVEARGWRHVTLDWA
ncbi:MAG: FkbM family methyltransferase [Pseudomonadota bacterium]